MSLPSIRLAAAGLVMIVGSPAAFAQPALPTGAPQKGAISSDKPAEYTLAVKTAGVRTIALHGSGNLAFAVTDADGQTLPDANVDRDMHGDADLEMACVTIPEPGAYRVRVRLQGSSPGSFDVSNAWLSFAALARPNTDADSKPSGAQRLQVGKPHEDAIDAEAGDVCGWFSLQAPEAKTLVIVTRGVGESSDLVLEAFLDGKFSASVERSDQDLPGDSPNDSTTVNVTAGRMLHVKVSSAFRRPSAKYHILSSLIS